MRVTLNKWNNGIVHDPRTRGEGYARAITDFDVYTDPHRIIPHRSSEDGDANSSTSKKENFCIGYDSANSIHRLYGLGVVSGTGYAEILYKDLTTGASNDLDDSAWAAPANNASAAGATDFELFVFYRRTGKIYGAKAGTNIWAMSLDGSTAFAENHRSISYDRVAQGLVHSKDDILYIPYDNKIAANDNGSWTDAALTLPEHLYISSIAERGNYILIGCAPLASEEAAGRSVLYLWDRDSSLTTLSDSVVLDEEVVRVCEDLDGQIVSISLAGGNTTRFDDRIVFRVNGRIEREIIGSSATLLSAKQRKDGRVYFLMSITVNGVAMQGIWSYGIDVRKGVYTLSHEYSPANGTALTNGVLEGFIIVGDYAFIAYQNNSGVYTLSKTDDQANYNVEATWYSTMNPKMADQDFSRKKQIKRVALCFDVTVANDEISLYYRVDGGSWVLIKTISSASMREFVQTQVSSGNGFKIGREYEFKIVSKGVKPHTLIYDYDLIGDIL